MNPLNPFATPGAAVPAPAEPPGPDLGSVPPPPRTASPRALALVMSLGPGGAGALFVGLVFLVVGSLFSSVFCGGLPQDAALALAGKTTPGTVVAQGNVPNVTVNGRAPRKFEVSFQVDGATHRATSYSVGSQPVLRNGEQVEVEYLPMAPDVARCAGTTRNEAGGGGVMMTLIFPLVGLFACAVPILGRARRRRAFLRGTATLGTVTSRGRDARRRSSRPGPVTLRWRFTAAGRPFTGQISCNAEALLPGGGAETQIVVLYDPRDPRVNTVWVD